MFDFVDTSGLPDAAVVFAEAEARRDPDRELRAPVSIVAGSVVDAVAVLVERGVVADPGPGVAARRDGVGGDDPASGVGGVGGVGPDGSVSDGDGSDGVGAGASGAGSVGAGVVDVGDVMVAVELVGRARRMLAAAESVMVARLEDAEASVKARGERTTAWLGRTQGLPGWKAAETTRVAAALDSTFDRFAGALAAGEIDHSYCAALVRASNERIEDALVDLQDELLARVPGRRFGAWRRELSAVCALLDADGPEPVVERDDKVFLSETLDGLVDLRGTFSGSTAEEVRQLVEAHTDRLVRRARRDARLTPDLGVPSRGVLRARAVLELLRWGSSGGGGGGPETHINLDVEAAPMPAEDTDTDTDSADTDTGTADTTDTDETDETDCAVSGTAGTDDTADTAETDTDPVGADQRADGHAGPLGCSIPHESSGAPAGQAVPGDGAPAGNLAQPAGLNRRPPVGELSRDWFRRVLGQRGDVLAGTARLADTNLWRLLCNPVIHTFVTDSAHEILQMGRAVRLATPAQRRALRMRDGGCVFPGCDAPIGWTQAHHVVHWSTGGRSDLASMGLLCTTHHDVTHRRDWQMLCNHDLHNQPDGTFRWISPSGDVLWSQRHGEFIP